MAKKALLVGINAYSTVTALRGCLNDITNIRHALLNNYGFAVEDISLLADQSATKDRMKSRMDWLIDKAKPGDSLVFHFSGHGSFIRDFSADEDSRELKDEADELICLHNMDFRDNSTYFIDDELRDWLAPVPEGVKMSVVLDCCHSGTGTKAIGLVPPMELRVNPSPEMTSLPSYGEVMSPSRLPSPLVTLPRFVEPPIDVLARMDERQLTSKREVLRNPMNHVLLAACRADQTAADAHLNGSFNGAFTYYLCKHIRESAAKLSYEDLVARIRQSLQFQGFGQLPQLEGSSLTLPAFE